MIFDRTRPVIEKFAKKPVPVTGSLNNRYRSKRDSVDWHGDAEDQLMPDAPITSVSFGGEPRLS